MQQLPDITIDPENLPTDFADRQAAGAISSFLSGLAPFFATAGFLEAEAKGYLAECERLTAPTTAEEDAEIQRIALRGGRLKKDAEDHWSGISVFHRFHRMLTAARDRGITALDRGRTIAASHHATFLRNEQRRVDDENRRRREESEKLERARQERDAAELEAKALEAEEASGDLSDRERRFVQYFEVGDPAPEQAAKAAGYKNASEMAARLMARPKIVAAIAEARKSAALRRQAAAVRMQPVHAPIVKEVAKVLKVGTTRYTWSGECFDLDAVRAAVLAGTVPLDVLTVDPVALNSYARDLHERLNDWPGCRAVSKPTVA